MTERGGAASDSSEYLYKMPCHQCGSKDNLAVYSDGHGFCFGACGFIKKRDMGDCVQGLSAFTQHEQRRGLKMSDEFLEGTASALPARKLTEETCSKWGYTIGEHHGKPVQIANYFRDGAVVAQKIRHADKTFVFKGDMKLSGLYGQHLWRDGGKKIVITEGEIDALSVSQMQDNKWPVVSVPNGAAGAAKSLARELEWLNKFEEVVLMLDSDEPGSKAHEAVTAAIEACAALFPPGKMKVARLPLKDASDMLKAGRGGEVITAIWGAKTYRPDGITTLSDLRDDILKVPAQGLPWWSPELTKLTYGRRTGEVYTFGAGTGVGKTDMFTQQIAYDATVLKEKVALFFFEQQPAETGKRVAGKVAGKCFHVPDGSWTQKELEGALDQLEVYPVYVYDHFGSCDWQNVRNRIRYLRHSEGVRLFYLDHLTALAAESDDERKALETIMAQIGSLVKELDIVLHLISHLATPEGKPHEEGGRVMARHFKGSRAIGFWCHFMFGLERNQQAEDERERTTTTFRVLKDRYTGRSTGKVLYLGYNPTEGRLFETTAPDTQEESGSKPQSDF